MRLKRSAVALLAAALGGACSIGSEDRLSSEMAESVVRDSAGVRFVENRGTPEIGWRVGEGALFTVGWEPDGPMFTWAQSGRIMPDGGALIGDFGAGSVYRVGSDGGVLDTWGRKGEGPGEYQGLHGILLDGDSILVSDGRLRRLTVLTWDGTVQATRPLPGAFLHNASANLSDGRLLLVPGDAYSRVAETRPEWVFETQPILAVGEAGVVDTLATLPHLRRWYGTRGASPGPVQVKGRAGGYTDGFAWARSDVPEVRWYDAAGNLEQVARWEEEPTPLTSEWKRRMTETFEEEYRSRGVEEEFVAAQLAQLDEGLDRYDGPLPYWAWFHVDRLGNVWLGQYTLPLQPPNSWRVISRDGIHIGVIELPGVIAILDITDDRVLAVRMNELDVSAVMMMELLKP